MIHVRAHAGAGGFEGRPLLGQRTDPATVARNFINQYGKSKFKRFIKLLKDGSSGETIAEEYGVSRERARQIEAALINRMREYVRQSMPDFELHLPDK